MLTCNSACPDFSVKFCISYQLMRWMRGIGLASEFSRHDVFVCQLYKNGLLESRFLNLPKCLSKQFIDVAEAVCVTVEL